MIQAARLQPALRSGLVDGAFYLIEFPEEFDAFAAGGSARARAFEFAEHIAVGVGPVGSGLKLQRVVGGPAAFGLGALHVLRELFRGVAGKGGPGSPEFRRNDEVPQGCRGAPADGGLQAREQPVQLLLNLGGDVAGLVEMGDPTEFLQRRLDLCALFGGNRHAGAGFTGLCRGQKFLRDRLGLREFLVRRGGVFKRAQRGHAAEIRAGIAGARLMLLQSCGQVARGLRRDAVERARRAVGPRTIVARGVGLGRLKLRRRDEIL